MFQEQPEKPKKLPTKKDIISAFKSDTQRLSDAAEELRQAEIDRIYEFLTEEPERWDGLS